MEAARPAPGFDIQRQGTLSLFELGFFNIAPLEHPIQPIHQTEALLCHPQLQISQVHEEHAQQTGNIVPVAGCGGHGDHGDQEQGDPQGNFFKPGFKCLDFYLPDQGTAIQVAYSIQGEAEIRETGNLIKAARELKDSKRFVIITYGEEKLIEEDGVRIEVIPLYKFLLDVQ